MRKIIIKLDNGEVWELPLSVVAHHYADQSKDYETDIEFAERYDKIISDDEHLRLHLRWSMRWDYILGYAKRVPDDRNYQNMFVNSEITIEEII